MCVYETLKAALGLSQHQLHVWPDVKAHQWWSVTVIPLLRRHVLQRTSLPFPLRSQERQPAVFLVFIEQEVKWTGRPGPVFRHRCSRARLGPGAHCSLSGNYRGLFLFLLLNSVWHCVSPQQRKVCVCARVCVSLLIHFTISAARWGHEAKEITDPLFP